MRGKSEQHCYNLTIKLIPRAAETNYKAAAFGSDAPECRTLEGRHRNPKSCGATCDAGTTALGGQLAIGGGLVTRNRRRDHGLILSPRSVHFYLNEAGALQRIFDCLCASRGKDIPG